MDKAVSEMKEDKRLLEISDLIVRLANADFTKQLEVSEKGDDIDSIIIGLNLIGEELESYIKQLKGSQKKVEHMLVQLTEAQHLSHVGSWEWDVLQNVMIWSDELYRICNRDPKNFESTFFNFMLCIHPDDRERVNGIIQKALENKSAFSFSHRSVRPDGVEVYFDGKGKVYLNETGDVIRMTGTVQDVTDLKKAEEKIINFASIVESSRDAIISKTLDGMITSWNPQAEKLFGYSGEEAVGKHISIIFPEERLGEEKEILRKIKEGEPLISYETERKRKDGSLVTVSATISPLKDLSGKIIGASKIVRDITAKKLTEERIMAYTQALEQKNKETEQFAYIASHDLQEPLRTITNYIGLFYDDYKGKLDPSADMYLDFISNASRRMQMLITDLLEYTRIENDNNPKQIDLNGLVKDVLSDMQQTIRETKAKVEVQNLPEMIGFTSRFRSLFQNLVSNAIKFRKPGIDPVIKISAKDLGKDWQFEISDNGIGIEKDFHEKIFMLFQRLHTRTEYEGTGIGLAHCKKIVELRGGRIWVESELNKGSRFYFTMPKKIMI